ncbi:DUF302 domain-containing protein [Bradyrhizobium sp. NAS80.1]|uniref:DUF302 domain-containing protein n=1 Tax=Bradyrhizobium sp. NAS80.1 TaxID=1680159 RepID=UPI0009FF5D95|nr:DUF302 domain-containing protein [Bradyrhizobium sp. NAS80.1]
MTNKPIVQVRYGEAGSDYAFQCAIVTGLSFDAVIAEIRAAISDGDLWVVHEIDTTALLARSGYEVGRLRQILFFHPRYMVRLLEANPAAVAEAPLKIVVMEEGGRTVVRWPIPEASLGRYGGQKVEELAGEFSSIYRDISARLSPIVSA